MLVEPQKIMIVADLSRDMADSHYLLDAKWCMNNLMGSTGILGDIREQVTSQGAT
jgi:hypothetical protein